MSVALAHPMHDPSAGQVGGIFAGIVALLVAIGQGVRWAVNYGDKRAVARAAKLDAWEARLDAREKIFEAQIEARMMALEAENRAYRNALSHVLPALRTIDPKHPSLRMADEALHSAFPTEFRIPPDMQNKLDEMP